MFTNNNALVIGNGYLAKFLTAKLASKNKPTKIMPYRDLINMTGEYILSNSFTDIFVCGFINRKQMNNKNSYELNMKAADHLIPLINESSNLFFASSIDVFGNDQSTIHSNLDMKPFDFYSAAKVDFETKLKSNIPLYSFYFPGLYGASLMEKSIISTMISHGMSERKITLSSELIRRVVLSYDCAASIMSQCSDATRYTSKSSDKQFEPIIPNCGCSYPLRFYANTIIERLEKYMKGNFEIQVDETVDTSGGRAQVIELIPTTNSFEHPNCGQPQATIHEFVDFQFNNEKFLPYSKTQS